MLIMTIFATAAQPAAASATPHQPPYARHQENVVVPVAEADRLELEEWGYADAVIDIDRLVPDRGLVEIKLVARRQTHTAGASKP